MTASEGVIRLPPARLRKVVGRRSCGVALTAGMVACVGPNPAYRTSSDAEATAPRPMGSGSTAAAQLPSGSSDDTGGTFSGSGTSGGASDPRSDADSDADAGSGSGDGSTSTAQTPTDDGAGSSSSSETGTGTSPPDLDVDQWEFGTPQTVPTMPASGEDDDPTVRADALELLFASTRNGSEQILRMTRANALASWGAPTVVTELDLAGEETVPRLAQDGLTLLFGSKTAGVDVDMYITTRPSRTDTWATPIPLDELNAVGTEQLPGTLLPDGLTLYYAHDDGTNDLDLMVATRSSTASPFDPGVPLTTLNSAADDALSWVDPTGTLIIFGSKRAGGSGGSDLWWARDQGSGFETPRPITAVNSVFDESDPWVADDLQSLYFSYDDGSASEIRRVSIVAP